MSATLHLFNRLTYYIHHEEVRVGGQAGKQAARSELCEVVSERSGNVAQQRQNVSQYEHWQAPDVVRHDAEPEGSQHRPYEEEGLSHSRLPVVVTHPVQLWTAERRSRDLDRWKLRSKTECSVPGS